MRGQREQVLEGGGLQVRFRFRDDRYAHEIWVADDDGTWHQALISVEGSPSDDWPASPAFQSIDMGIRPGDRPCALLVGKAGGNHYSASVEVDSTVGLRFDVACRTRGGQNGGLGSCYRAIGRPCCQNVATAVVAIDTAGPAELVVNACNELGPSRFEISGAALNIVPLDVPVRPEANTIRWGYTLTRRERAVGRGVFY